MRCEYCGRVASEAIKLCKIEWNNGTTMQTQWLCEECDERECTALLHDEEEVGDE